MLKKSSEYTLCVSLFFFVIFILPTSVSATVLNDNQKFSSYNCETNEEYSYSISNWANVKETPGTSDNNNDISTTQIIGDCNFIKIENPSEYQNTRAVAFLTATFKYGDNNEITTRTYSTATMIGNSTALTAAHCIYNANYGGYADFVTISPARNGSSYHYGTTKATKLSIPSLYKTKNIPANDIAVINLLDPIGRKSGYLSCKCVDENTLTYYYTIVDLIGYPKTGEKNLSGETTKSGEMWGMGGSITSVDGKTLQHLCDAVNGHSGSALVYMQKYIVGVHNKYPRNDTTFNWGCRIDSEYLKWINGLIK